MANEFTGQFIFAKRDIDEQPELMKQYTVENVPSLKVFVDGAVVQTEEGQLNHQELRDVLKGFGVFSQIDDMRQQAREKHISGDTLEGMQLLTQAMQQDPSNIKVAMDMGQY